MSIENSNTDLKLLLNDANIGSNDNITPVFDSSDLALNMPQNITPLEVSSSVSNFSQDIVFAPSLSPKSGEYEIVEMTDITGNKFTALIGEPNLAGLDWKITDQYTQVITDIDSLSADVTTETTFSPQLVNFLEIKGTGFIPVV